MYIHYMENAKTKANTNREKNQVIERRIMTRKEFKEQLSSIKCKHQRRALVVKFNFGIVKAVAEKSNSTPQYVSQILHGVRSGRNTLGKQIKTLTAKEVKLPYTMLWDRAA